MIKKTNSVTLYKKILVLAVMAAVFVSVGFGLLIFTIAGDEALEHGIGDSKFYKKDGQIYALVVGGGYMRVQGADADSFCVLGQKDAARANSAGSNSKEPNLTQPNLSPKNLTRPNSTKSNLTSLNSTEPNSAAANTSDTKNLSINILNTDAKTNLRGADLSKDLTPAKTSEDWAVSGKNSPFAIQEKFYRGSNLAADKNAVYCGNLPLAGLDAGLAKTFGVGYVSDGKISYFCDANAVANEDLGVMKLFLGMVSHALFDAPEPQVYIYKFKRINAPYMTQIMGANYATDGARAYYKGEILEGADPLNLSMIKGENGRESDFYSRDKAGVYFGATRLDVKNSAQDFLALDISGHGMHEYYLFAKNGEEVFAKAHKFKPEAAPYTPLNKDDEHSYHLFFLSKEGIFYFDWKRQEQQRVGDNPFKGVPKPLSGSVFEEGGQIYFFAGREIWGDRRSRHVLSSGLHSRNSALFTLKMPHAWHKIGGVHEGTFGAVYANGGRYFYFDDLGHLQLSYAPIYEISGKGTLEALLNKNIRVGEIHNMLKEGRLTAVEGEMLFEVKTSYRKFWGF